MSSASSLLLNVNEKVKFHGHELGHEQSITWPKRYLQTGVYHERCSANWGCLMRRDIVPLPSHRRTWDVMEYLGFGRYLRSVFFVEQSEAESCDNLLRLAEFRHRSPHGESQPGFTGNWGAFCDPLDANFR